MERDMTEICVVEVKASTDAFIVYGAINERLF